MASDSHCCLCLFIHYFTFFILTCDNYWLYGLRSGWFDNYWLYVFPSSLCMSELSLSMSCLAVCDALLCLLFLLSNCLQFCFSICSLSDFPCCIHFISYHMLGTVLIGMLFLYLCVISHCFVLYFSLFDLLLISLLMVSMSLFSVKLSNIAVCYLCALFSLHTLGLVQWWPHFYFLPMSILSLFHV